MGNSSIVSIKRLSNNLLLWDAIDDNKPDRTKLSPYLSLNGDIRQWLRQFWSKSWRLPAIAARELEYIPLNSRRIIYYNKWIKIVEFVTIIGAASTARQCIKAGLADELHIDIMPVLLGSGLRLFDYSEMDPIQLERLQVMELPAGRTHLRFRFIK